jgi:acetyl esterase/lipase
VAQLLLTPVTDADFTRRSYVENAQGFVLTADLMRWFWDHYIDGADRSDPRASPLRADRLDGLPPAVIVTAELDPLRDEGAAYASALDAAGVPVRHIAAVGHTHTSLLAVDLLPSGAAVRARLVEALRDLLGVPVRA